MTNVQNLQKVILDLHHVRAIHVESVPISEYFQGEIVWEGTVEVFDLKGHDRFSRVYAWSQDTGDPMNPKRHVTVLHKHPVTSPVDAVRAAILQDYRDAGTKA